MPTHRLSEAEIQMLIGATSTRWPAADSDLGRTIAFDRMRKTVAALRDLATGLNDAVAAAEQDGDLSSDGIQHKRATLGIAALKELGAAKHLVDAEKAVRASLEFLGTKLASDFKPPETVAEASDAVELRSFIKAQRSPIDFCMKHLDNPKVASAVLNTSIPELCGLSGAELEHIRHTALARLHPNEVQARAALTRAHAETTAAVAAAKRLICERCELVDDGDEHYRSIHDREPQRRLSAVNG